MAYQNQSRSAFGIATFGKAPLVSLDEDWSADVAVLGAPFDQAVTYRPGARFGPAAIRDSSLRFDFFSKPSGFWDVCSETWRAKCKVVDCGDTNVVPLDYEQCFTNIRSAVAEILRRGAMPVVLGGDHSITLPVLQAYEGRGPISLVHFDAHTDYRDHVQGVKIGHAQVIRRASELPWIEHILSLGIRALRTDPDDIRLFRERGHTLVHAFDLHEKGVARIADLLPLGKKVYITFDIDAMDPAIAPGTGTPEFGGLHFMQVRAILELIAARNEVVGFDLVEVNPMIDPSQITAILGAQIALAALGFIFPSTE